MKSPMDIEQRVTLSLDLQRYLRAVEKFESSSREFNEACQGLRANLMQPRRFIFQVSFRHYLVTSDSEGNFEVEQIESV